MLKEKKTKAERKKLNKLNKQKAIINQKKKDTLFKYLIIVLITILGLGIVFIIKSHQSDQKVLLSPHIKGNPESNIVLSEYSDFQCPACRNYSSLIDKVVNKYQKNIRFEYYHFPLISLHPNAVGGALASEAAAKQGKFWQMYSKLFENQSEWSDKPNPLSSFTKYAKELGLDIKRFKNDYSSKELADKVRAQRLKANGLGLNGTPSIFLNGKKINNPRTMEEFDALFSNLIPDVSTVSGELNK